MTLVKIPEEVRRHVPVDLVWHYKVVPISDGPMGLTLLVEKEKNSTDLQEELEVVLGRKISLQEAESSELNQLIIREYPRGAQTDNQRIKSGSSFIGNGILEELITEAKELKCSDIHIEIYGENCRIRFRVDGSLIERHAVNKADYPSLINKIKIAAGCDIAEKRLPQDGRIRTKSGEKSLDIRVSILPTLYGEKIVLRLLGTDSENISLESLGFSENELNRFKQALNKPHGLILISGPTGSGKTTTLYATLKLLSKPKVNILTIEDPIEYTLNGINQVQLKEDIGLTFPQALRTFLRQDPDIIMLGEIRDAETAQMAVRAALTGHLVLSTIHTNSAWGTISRLIDMGVESYLLSNVINLSVAQRLIRVLCNNCKTSCTSDLSSLQINLQGGKAGNYFKANGCEECHYSGYKGRKAIYEVVPVSTELQNLVRRKEPTIDDYYKRKNISTLSESAIREFENGTTSLDEVYPFLLDNEL